MLQTQRQGCEESTVKGRAWQGLLAASSQRVWAGEGSGGEPFLASSAPASSSDLVVVLLGGGAGG